MNLISVNCSVLRSTTEDVLEQFIHRRLIQFDLGFFEWNVSFMECATTKISHEVLALYSYSYIQLQNMKREWTANRIFPMPTRADIIRFEFNTNLFDSIRNQGSISHWHGRLIKFSTEIVWICFINHNTIPSRNIIEQCCGIGHLTDIMCHSDNFDWKTCLNTVVRCRIICLNT